MTYFELSKVIEKMTDEQKQQHVAVADRDVGEFYWVSRIGPVVECGLNPIWLEGIKDTQIVVVV